VKREELKTRTKQFGLRVMKLVDALPKTTAGRTIGNQLIRSGTSIGANYRAACRGRSIAEFIAKIGIVAEELTAIFTAAGRTAKQNNPKSKIKDPSNCGSRIVDRESNQEQIQNPRSKIQDPKSGGSNA
jgi:four helix bundle protein